MEIHLLEYLAQKQILQERCRLVPYPSYLSLSTLLITVVGKVMANAFVKQDLLSKKCLRPPGWQRIIWMCYTVSFCALIPYSILTKQKLSLYNLWIKKLLGRKMHLKNKSKAEIKLTGKLDGLSCCIIFKSSWLVFPEAIGGGCVLFP